MFILLGQPGIPGQACLACTAGQRGDRGFPGAPGLPGQKGEPVSGVQCIDHFKSRLLLFPGYCFCTWTIRRTVNEFFY